MNMTYRNISIYAKLIITAFICISSTIGAYAQSDNFDLLCGMGDFEKCSYSIVAGLDDYGIIPTNNLSVANGWSATIDLAKKTNYIFQVVNSGTFARNGSQYLQVGKSYQYMGMNNTSAPPRPRFAELSYPFQYKTKYLSDIFKTGDKVEFHIDKIISSNFLPGHQSVYIGMSYTVQGDATVRYAQKAVDLSAGVASNVTYTLESPSVTNVRPFIQLHLNDNSTTANPTGILLTGAKVFILRNGHYVTEEVPYTRNRTIQTNILGGYRIAERSIPPKGLAKYDHVVAMAYDYVVFSALRKLNPNIKIYIYQGGTDAHDVLGRPARWCLAPLKMEYVIAQHLDWLLPQTHPKAKNDPDTGNSTYVAQYANAGGIVDRYWISKVTNKTYQDEWANSVIQLVKSVGADGVFIDNCTNLSREEDGFLRNTSDIQRFLHGVIPQLKSAGVTTVVNNAIANLDGLASPVGDIAEVYYNPTWKPTAALPVSAGYSANSPDNTPDVFFREFSFIYNNYGYNSAYWLKCLNDAKIISAWNALQPNSKAKRIQYSAKQYDTVNNPAYDRAGKPGWISFVLASFLLCSNEFIDLGISLPGPDGNYYEAMVDFSITQRLGVPDGEDVAIDNNKYFRKRYYKPNGVGSFGGIVVVNAEGNKSHAFVVPFDVLDENGTLYLAGTTINMLPNMGRILVNASTFSDVGPDISLAITASTASVKPRQVVTITVRYTNNGATEATTTHIQAVVPDKLKYVPGVAEASGGAFDSTTNTVHWIVSGIAAGQSGTRVFKAKLE